MLYGLAWMIRDSIEIIRPMANLRYFYYGKKPGHWSDNALYVFFYPIYKVRYHLQSLKNAGHCDVHWSDRREGIMPTPEEEQERAEEYLRKELMKKKNKKSNK